MSYNSVISPAESNTAAAANTDTGKKSNLNQADFLTLLVTQLTHQDPMNPMDDKEITSQLAEFSSLEQLTKVNTQIETIIAANNRQELYTAVGFIGKEVKAAGYQLAKEGEDVSTIYYGLGETVTNLTINIHDKDGDIVHSKIIGAKNSGYYEYEWDGKDVNGNSMADGTYSVSITGEDVNGKSVYVKTDISGVVSGVVNENGEQFLRLKDGRYVKFTNVTEIVSPGNESNDNEENGNDNNNNSNNGG